MVLRPADATAPVWMMRKQGRDMDNVTPHATLL